jgi:5-(carboxyamino)imidazole ribonucleotide synthase
MTPILPGATLGVLGSGQLGRMFALAARRMGYRVHVLSPDQDSPTGHVADVEISASYDDLDAVAEFARQAAVVTFEFENVPAPAAEAAARFAPVRPDYRVLHTTQNRLREKSTLAAAGFPVTPFRAVQNSRELSAALEQLGRPAVLKTSAWGYDGKGQIRIDSGSDVEDVWRRLETSEAILEAFIDFHQELSVVAARSLDGSTAQYGPIANRHVNHILDLSIYPAEAPLNVAQEALQIARAVMEHLDVVGVLCVEFFLTSDGRLLINELAPRPHNSGHLTIDACVTCQFEQQVRAVCGLPLGSDRLLAPAAMANLLGDLWSAGTPNWKAALANPEVKLHLYGKRDPLPGRKMGHLTALGATPQEAAERVLAARAALTK